MVEVMKIMVTSFKRSHACTATLNAPKCSSPPPTHASTRDSCTLMGKSGSVSYGSLLLSPGSWCPQAFVFVLQEYVSPVVCKFRWLYGGEMATSSRRTYAVPRSTAPRAPAPAAVHC